MEIKQVKRRMLALPPDARKPCAEFRCVDSSSGDQAMAVPSGGSSRREERRAGRTHREEVVRRLSDDRGRMYPIIESVAVFQTGLTDSELGRPESPHGVEFKQGLGLASSGPSPEGGVGGRTFVFRGPQQHEAWRHIGPQLQPWACSSASNSDDDEIEEARLASLHARPKRSTAASVRQRCIALCRAF